MKWCRRWLVSPPPRMVRCMVKKVKRDVRLRLRLLEATDMLLLLG